MNTRIKELAKEAALVYKIIPPPATHTTPLYLIDNFKKMKDLLVLRLYQMGFVKSLPS